jgi:hypothetical protein
VEEEQRIRGGHQRSGAEGEADGEEDGEGDLVGAGEAHVVVSMLLLQPRCSDDPLQSRQSSFLITMQQQRQKASR